MLMQGEVDRRCSMSVATVICIRRHAVHKHFFHIALLSQQLAKFTVLCSIPSQLDRAMGRLVADLLHVGNQSKAEFLVCSSLRP